jgi:tetratricopeptide (TPR) repeat protein
MAEIPLIRHENFPSLILRAEIEVAESTQGQLSGVGQRNTQPSFQRLFSDGITAYEDFGSRGNLQSLEQAILKFQAIAEMTPENDKRLPDILNNIGSFLFCRFEALGRLADLTKAIEQLERALELTPDGDPYDYGCLTNLGNCLQARFLRLGNLADIDAAIARQQTAVDLIPDGRPDKPMCLTNLGNCLENRFQRLGNLDDIEAAIIRQQAAVNLATDDHPDKPSCLTNLGNCLQTRFERLGNLSDIDAAITQLQAAINLTQDGHPAKASRLNNLGNSLHIRFERLGNLGDLDAMIIQQQAAVNLTPDDHPDKPLYLGNLGSSLETRFQRLGNLHDIDVAITQQQTALNLLPDGHPKKPGRLTSLGNCLQSRFQRLGNLADIDAAIIHQKAAVDLTPDGHPNKPGWLSNLGVSLQIRFERLGSLDDVKSAITQQQESVNLTPDGHPDRPTRLVNLGDSFALRFFRFNDLLDAQTAISYFSASAQSSAGPPGTLLQAAKNWIAIASLIKHHSLLTAFERALDLMPRVAWLGLPISDRHEHLIRIGRIARDAAAVAISLGEYNKALEWLEQGRSIVWNQILQLRTPVDELRSIDSDLADRLVQVSRLLDGGIKQEGSLGSAEEDAQRYRALTMEWESIIARIRSIPHFDDFLKAPKVSRLMDVALDGPVVVLNITEMRCDALALVAGIDEVIHIPLPDVTSKKATQLRDELKNLLYSSGLRLRGDRAAERWTDEEGSIDCKDILAEVWNGLVKPVLDSLAFSVSFLRYFISILLTLLSPGASGCAPTYLVVSNRATCLSSYTCGWNLQLGLD